MDLNLRGKTALITGASRAKNHEEFEFHRRKIPATPKLNEKQRKRCSRPKNSDEKLFSTSENEMFGIV